jgi:DHA2 family multidrug resistance protein-like MFS transporter
MVALVGLTYALKEVAKPAPQAGQAALACLIGLLFLVWFVVRQKRSTSPTVDFALFRSSGFFGGSLAIIVAMVALMGVQLILMQRLQLVLGFTPLRAGLFVIPMSLASFFSGPVIGSFLLRLGIERALWIALLIGATGLAGLAYFQHGAFAPQIVSLVIFGFGAGAVMSTSSTAIMINAPEDKAGMAGSIESVAYELGAVIGVAVMGGIATFIYSTSIVLPGGLPDAQPARDSLDQALILAERLNVADATQLIANAETAYDRAYLWVVLAGGVAMSVLGFIYAFFLRPMNNRNSGAPGHLAADAKAG